MKHSCGSCTVLFIYSFSVKVVGWEYDGNR